jgi:hypothetical protein
LSQNETLCLKNPAYDVGCAQDAISMVIQYRDWIKVEVVRPWKFRSTYLIAASEHLRACQDPSEESQVDRRLVFTVDSD